jgi:8-oxo-dGTP pyrophosphatase MutT (NUDIX family)
VFAGSPEFDAPEAALTPPASSTAPVRTRRRRANGLMSTVFAKLDCTPRWRERLWEITTPTLMVHGAVDPFFPVGNAEALAAAMPSATLKILDGSAQSSPATRRWLRRCRRPRRRNRPAIVEPAATVAQPSYGGPMVRLYQRLLRRIGLGRRTTPRHRAVAVVIDGERLLVIKRHKRGRDYAVLPGGGVEHAETAAQAAVRELWEETTLTAEIDRPLWTGRHKDRPASYFLMSAARGRARLSGPEARAHRPDNSFELCWITADQFAELGLFPPDVRDPLVVSF